MEALFGFLGVLAGVVITIFFQRKSEIFNNRLKVYSDFIDTFSTQINCGPDPDSIVKMSSFKIKVLLIGSKKVIHAITDLFSGRTVFDNDATYNSFTAVIDAMRKDLQIAKKVNKREIDNLLYNSDESPVERKNTDRSN